MRPEDAMTRLVLAALADDAETCADLLSSSEPAEMPAVALSRAIAQRYPGCELTVAYIDSYGDSVGASWIAD